MLEALMQLEMVDVVMNAILAAVIFFIVLSLVRAHRTNGASRYKDFNLIDLFADRDGRASRPAVMEMTAFLVMTWGFITLTVGKSLTEWYAGIYIGAFVFRGAHAAWLRIKSPQATQEKPASGG